MISKGVEPRIEKSRLRAPRVLVVDDESESLLYVEANLRASGYEIIGAADGTTALARFAEAPPDLVVLDLMMPGADGFTVCREIRRTSRVPIIVLSARDREFDKVRALDMGADDYLTKPFGVEEFLARIRAALRRNHFFGEGAGPDTLVRAGPVLVDIEARRVSINGKPIKLTPTEFSLVVELAQHAGRVVTQRQLLQRVWGASYGTEGSYLHTYIRRLRQKIEPDPQRPAILMTDPGVGYFLSATE